MKFEVTIGWTKSDRANGYSSFDGYKPGAEQHTETIEVEWTNGPMSGIGFDNVDVDALVEGTNLTAGTVRLNAMANAVESTVLGLAEAVFTATNAPFTSGLASQVAEKIAATGYHGEGAHYSLSVGDTVTVGEVTMACAPTGWERVTLRAPQIAGA